MLVPNCNELCRSCEPNFESDDLDCEKYVCFFEWQVNINGGGVFVNFCIRAMRTGDFNAILKIQELCFSGSLHEDLESLMAKLRASPTTCFVAENVVGEIVAYLFTVPWMADSPPALSALQCVLPKEPNCLYIHDLSVHPKARGQCLGDLMVQTSFATAKQLGLGQCCLVAVQNSEYFWRRFGFKVDEIGRRDSEVGSYGDDACFMSIEFTCDT